MGNESKWQKSDRRCLRFAVGDSEAVEEEVAHVLHDVLDGQVFEFGIRNFVEHGDANVVTSLKHEAVFREGIAGALDGDALIYAVKVLKTPNGIRLNSEQKEICSELEWRQLYRDSH